MIESFVAVFYYSFFSTPILVFSHIYGMIEYVYYSRKTMGMTTDSYP